MKFHPKDLSCINNFMPILFAKSCNEFDEQRASGSESPTNLSKEGTFGEEGGRSKSEKSFMAKFQ